MVGCEKNGAYVVWGGVQDKNAWCGPSASAAGRITGSEWFTVSGGDGEYAVPAPSDSTPLYVDSQNGNIVRLDLRTGRTRLVRPYLRYASETRPANLEYRFNWTTPIEVSATDASTVYLGGNVVFKTMDAGEHWAPISPDLTRNDKTKQVTSGGPIEYDISGAESYNTILTVNLAPTDPNTTRRGTDHGLVHPTRHARTTPATV